MAIFLLALTVAGLVAATRAEAMDIGIQDDSVFLFRRYYDRSLAYRQATRLGANLIRFNITWGDFQRVGFPTYDDAVKTARAHHMKVLISLFGTPSYIRGEDKRLSNRRPSPRLFASFVSEIARHFRGRVRYYGLWNEPNLDRFLSPQSRAPQMYRALYRAGYAAVKHADPGAGVLFGETTSAKNSLGFLRKVASRGHLLADGLGHHPFQFGAAPGKPDHRFTGISNLPRINAALRDLARRHRLSTPAGRPLSVFGTEFAYLRKGIYQQSESSRARWAPAAFRYAARQHVHMLLWYQLVRPPGWALRDAYWDSGLVALNGTPTSTYRRLAAVLPHLR